MQLQVQMSLFYREKVLPVGLGDEGRPVRADRRRTALQHGKRPGHQTSQAVSQRGSKS